MSKHTSASGGSVGRLLVTADDACASPTIDAAIAELAELGYVTNASVLINCATTRKLEYLQDAGCATSIHFNLSSGPPISPPQNIASLLGEDGAFLKPIDCVRENDTSLFESLQRYRSDIVTGFDPLQVRLELKAQERTFRQLNGGATLYNSFHHDLDEHPTIKSILRGQPKMALTRQGLQHKRLLSGFQYFLFPIEISVDTCTTQIVTLLREAVKASAERGGVPYEIALHPATDAVLLDGFTVYALQRVVEFRAWLTPSVREFFKHGRRNGEIWEFDLSWSK